MLTATAAAIAPPAARLLTPPARYRLVFNRIVGMQKKYQVHNLWMQLFDVNTFGSDDDEFALSEDLIMRVHQELFDLDLEYTMEIMYSVGENPLHYPIYINGYRIPWEVAHLCEMYSYQRPLAAAIIDSRLLEYGDEIDTYYAEVLWDKDTFVLPESQAELRAVVERLAAQPEPFNALADLLEYSVELRTDNFFMMTTNVGGAGDEYMPRDLFWWTVEDIRTLTEHCTRAKPAIERINAYADWFEHAQATGVPDYCPHRATLRVLREVAYA